MKTNIATTQDQAARLLRCGVSADTADMCLSTRTRRYDGTFIAKKHQTTNLWIGYPCRRTTSGDEELENIPAWSLSALLGLLPKRIKRGDYSNYTLSLSCDGCFWDLEYTHARYCGEDDSLVLFEDTDPIEVCVKAIEWLKEHNYKLNEQ